MAYNPLIFFIFEFVLGLGEALLAFFYFRTFEDFFYPSPLFFVCEKNEIRNLGLFLFGGGDSLSRRLFEIRAMGAVKGSATAPPSPSASTEGGGA